MKPFELTQEEYNSFIEQINNFPKINLGNLTDKIIDSDKKNQRIITTLEKPNLGQVILAIPTIFTQENKINYEVLEQMLKQQANAGIKEILIAGTTGLVSSMSHKEQIEYIEKAINIANKYGLKVVAGTGANDTFEQNSLTKQAFEKGAVASLLLAPYYIKASNDMLLNHFLEALNYGPGIIYSIYGRAAIQIPIEVLKELSKHPNFIGVKECDGGNRIKELSDYGIKVWSGNDDQVPKDVHTNGAYGTITVAGNLRPDLVQELVSNPKITENTENYSQVLNSILFLPEQPNPKGIANIQAMINQYEDPNFIAGFRKPVGIFSKIQQKEIQKTMQKILGFNTEILKNPKMFPSKGQKDNLSKILMNL